MSKDESISNKELFDLLHKVAAGEDVDSGKLLSGIEDAEERASVGAVLSDLRASSTGPAPAGSGELQPAGQVGEFRLLRMLGKGGMGTVWEAEQSSLNRRVALKVLSSHLGLLPRQLERFHREAEAGGRLQHSAIVQVYATGEAGGQHYIAQELIKDGNTLGHWLDEMRGEKELPPDYYRKVAKQFVRIAEALQVAHDAAVVHRDVKPGNILLTAEGEPKIADFGLAKLEDSVGLTRSAEFAGTPAYMSPEQAASQRMGIDHRSDIFSLGSTLYEALTLTRPFLGDTFQQVVRKILLDDPPRPQKLRSRVPADLEVICLKALEKDPERRFQSMSEFAADLKRYLADEPIHARPPGFLTRGVKWLRRHPVITTAVAVTNVALVVVLLLLFRTQAAEHEARRSGEEARWENYVARIGAAEQALQNENAGEAARYLAEAPEEYRGWEWDHLSGRLDRSHATFALHRNLVRSVTYDSEGKRLLTASWDGTLKLSEAFTGEVLRTFAEHGDFVIAARFSPDESLIASASFDGTVRLWDAVSGHPLRTLVHPDGQKVADLAFSATGRYLASASYGGLVRVWDVQTGQPVQTLEGHRYHAYSVAFDPRSDGRLATASWDGTVRVWSVSRAEAVRAFVHDSPFWAVAYDPAGDRLAAASEDGTVHVWSLEDGSPLAVLEGHDFTITSLAFDPAGDRLLTGSWDGTARLWDARSYAEIATLTGHRNWVWGVAFRPDGAEIATSSADGTVKLWSAGLTGGQVPALRHHAMWVYGVAISPDGATLASASLDGTGRLVDLATRDSDRPPLAHGGRVSGVAFAGDGSRVVTYAQDDTVRVWDPRTGELQKTLQGHASKVDVQDPATLACSPAGDFVALGSGTRSLRLWDLDSGEFQDLDGHAAQVSAVAISPDGSTVASGSLDGAIRLWDARTGELRRELSGHGDGTTPAPVGCLDFSPDGGRLASAGWDLTARIWSVESGDEVARLVGHSGWVIACAFSRHDGGRRLATGSADTTIRLWDGHDGRPVATLHGHDHAVTGLAFHPGGRLLASCGADKTVRLWEAQQP